MQSREIRLKSYPEGLPTPDDFELATVELPDPADGKVLVRNHYMSVDPYMRGRMRDSKSYAPPFALGAPLNGHSVGEVVTSTDPDFKPGDAVAGFGGWRDHCIASGADLVRVDPTLAPLQTYLGTLGMPGMTAYVGLLDIGAGVFGAAVGTAREHGERQHQREAYGGLTNRCHDVLPLESSTLSRPLTVSRPGRSSRRPCAIIRVYSRQPNAA